MNARCRGVVLAAFLLGLGCGGGSTRTGELRASLSSDEGRAARERAPDLVAELEAALTAAEEAEARGDAAAADDLTTRARLLWQAASAEVARLDDEATRATLEARIAETLRDARRDEEAREEVSLELARRQGLRTAREEIARALAQAEEDEGRGPRQARVSLSDDAEIRRATAALRDRTRLTLAAATALGADATVVETAEAALRASEAASRDPRAALHQADVANQAAMAALGAARRAADEGPGRDEVSALAEAAREAGFEVVSAPEGLGVAAAGLFRGNAIGAPNRVERLVALLEAYPRGPVQVQAQAAEAGAAGDRNAERRAEALRAALTHGGVEASRLSAQAIPSALRGDTPMERARLVFVAYTVTP